MRGAQAAPAVAVEILVEQDVVAKVRVVALLVAGAVDRAATLAICAENAGEPARQFFGDLIKAELAAGARRALHLQSLAVKVGETVERVHEQVIDREPDGAAPVGIAAEEA